jgi:hypothetical protein
MKTVSITLSLTDERAAALEKERAEYNKSNESAQATDLGQFLGKIAQSNFDSRADNLIGREAAPVTREELRATQEENARLKAEAEKARTPK